MRVQKEGDLILQERFVLKGWRSMMVWCGEDMAMVVVMQRTHGATAGGSGATGNTSGGDAVASGNIIERDSSGADGGANNNENGAGNGN